MRRAERTMQSMSGGEGDHGGGGGGVCGGVTGTAWAMPSPVPMEPRRRNLWDPAPLEGPADGVFTVEIHHGGFFCGLGTNRKYVDEKVDHFDFCQLNNWSCQFIDDFLKEMCYDLADPKLAVYWFKKLSDNSGQLVAVHFETTAREMAAAVVHSNPIILHVDHVDFLVNQLSDDVAQSGVCLPKVLSPRKGGYVQEDESAEEDDSENDPDFCDSDYDFEEDDGLFGEYVDDIVLQQKPVQKFRRGEDDVPEEVDLHGIDGPKYNFSYHNPITDKDNPVFKIGMIFPTVKDVRKAVSMYAVTTRYQVRKSRNNSTRVEAYCQEGCPWTFIASKDSRTESILLKTYVGTHTCERVWKVKELTGPLLTELIVEEFRINENMTLKGFANKVQQQYNIVPDRFKLARARLAALKKIRGDDAAQYNHLWDYGQELRTANPCSSFYLKCVGNSFSSLYLSLDACKRGWLRGCRPIICLDGTHIKTRYGGQLLTAIGIDPNDCIYPIAMAIVEVECYSSWLWFLNTLKNDLNIVNTSPFTIMSDKQKGLIKAVLELFPDSEHRFCVRHMHQNMNQLHKGELVKNHVWACARATNVERWTDNMEKFKSECPDAHAWLEEMPPNTWCRAFFSDFPKCDILLNNTCEVFNNWILEARELPILSMLERVVCQLMTRYYDNEKQARENWDGQICPKIKMKLEKNVDWAADIVPRPSRMGVFKVGSMNSDNIYIVELNLRSCTYRRWQLTGIACSHACACMRHENINPEKYVSPCYSIKTYLQAYGTFIKPVRDMKEWTKINGPDIKSPFYEKVVGRPTKSRRKAPEEKKGGTKLSRHGVQIHCRYCKGADHNIAGCEVLKAELLAESQANGEQEQDIAGTSTKPAKRKRKTAQQQVSVPNPTRKPTSTDENGDADVPEIRQHIVHVNLDPSLDPTNLTDSMVSQLSHEVPTVILNEQEPFPEESEFVAHNREQIPIRTTVTTTTSLRGKCKARASATAATTIGRGRGRTTTTASIGRGRTATATAAGRGRGRTATATSASRGRGRTIGRGEWLLFGEGGANGSQQAGTESQDDPTVLESTQEPPPV